MKNTGTQSVNTTSTDASRDARENVSHTTSINQMYQLFNAYHLGTNRAVFVVTPRAHTISPTTFSPIVPNPPNYTQGDSPAEFNLINGARQLEGIQDVFLVVYVPNSLRESASRGLLTRDIHFLFLAVPAPFLPR